MPGRPAARLAGHLLRLTAAGLLSIAAACGPSYQASMDVVVLPEATEHMDARVQRNAQLRTGTHLDDIPEYTGAPGPNARWPSQVPRTGKTVYRDAASMVVGSEGPVATTAD